MSTDQDIVTVTRVLVYTGPRSHVMRTLNKSIQDENFDNLRIQETARGKVVTLLRQDDTNASIGEVK
jgi:hypothetical protein